MITAFIASAFVAAHAALPMLFLSPDDLVDARGVRIEVQQPIETRTLVPKDDQRPSLWYSPSAAYAENGETWVWYQRIDKSEPVYVDQRTFCFGVVRDGQWRLPAVNPEPPAWGGPNNVVLTRSPCKPTWGGFNVFQIVRDQSGYTLLYGDQPSETGEAGAMLAKSPDGKHWVKDPRGAVFIEHNDAYSLLKMGNEYVLFQTALEDWPDKPYPDNLDKYRRVISLRTSPDLITWSPQQPLIRPDQLDKPETEFYLMKAFPYAGRFAGILFKYYADPALPNKHSAIYRNELIVSDDAHTWKRPFRDHDLPFWTYAEPFNDSGKLCFVAADNGGIVLHAYRPFGLTAVVADEEGQFITRPLNIAARGLTLHADVSHGALEVTILPQSPALSVENSEDEAFALRPPEPASDDENVRLAIRLKNAKLFSITTAD